MAKWQVSYKVDLNSSFNRAFGDKPASTRSKLRSLLDQREVRLSIGRDIIEKIITTTNTEAIIFFIINASYL